MGNHKLSNANFPVDETGATYHVGARRGDIANRIITVGDPARAIQLAALLDGGEAIDAKKHAKFLHFRNADLMIKTSPRLFTVATGRFRGTPVSIVAIGMGTPMMDFFVREARAVVDGPLVIIRFGSCGSIGSAHAGDVVVATESGMCARNVDWFADHPHDQETAVVDKREFARIMDAGAGPYTLSRPVAADKHVCAALAAALKQHVPASTGVVEGLDTTADSFYSSQGRIDERFSDANEHLIDYITDKRANAECLQMETFALYHLARSARPLSNGTPSIRAAGCAMVFAARRYNSWIDPDVAAKLQVACSRAVLDAVTSVAIDKGMEHPETGSVWCRGEYSAKATVVGADA